VPLEIQALRGVHLQRLECEKNWTVVVAGGGVSRSGKGLVSDYPKFRDAWDHLHVPGDCRDDLCPASSDDACRYVRGDDNKEVPEGKGGAVRVLFWGSSLGAPFPSELFKRLGGAACRYSVYLLYWYKSTNTDAARAAAVTRVQQQRSTPSLIMPQQTLQEVVVAGGAVTRATRVHA
jgi:hypothetical protein